MLLRLVLLRVVLVWPVAQPLLVLLWLTVSAEVAVLTKPVMEPLEVSVPLAVLALLEVSAFWLAVSKTLFVLQEVLLVTVLSVFVFVSGEVAADLVQAALFVLGEAAADLAAQASVFVLLAAQASVFVRRFRSQRRWLGDLCRY